MRNYSIIVDDTTLYENLDMTAAFKLIKHTANNVPLFKMELWIDGRLSATWSRVQDGEITKIVHR